MPSLVSLDRAHLCAPDHTIELDVFLNDMEAATQGDPEHCYVARAVLRSVKKASKVHVGTLPGVPKRGYGRAYILYRGAGLWTEYWVNPRRDARVKIERFDAMSRVEMEIYLAEARKFQDPKLPILSVQLGPVPWFRARGHLIEYEGYPWPEGRRDPHVPTSRL